MVYPALMTKFALESLERISLDREFKKGANVRFR